MALIRIHQFFLPELVYLLQRLGTTKLINISNLILKETWMKNTLISHPSRIDSSKISKLNVVLKPYQKAFLELYDNRKQKYNLKGWMKLLVGLKICLKELLEKKFPIRKNFLTNNKYFT